MKNGIIIFAYDRADHLKKCVDSVLEAAPEGADIIIFHDICSETVHQDTKRNNLNSIRYSQKLVTNTNIKLCIRDEPFGLRKNIIDGISTSAKIFDYLYIIEDDIILAPMALHELNKVLNNNDKNKIIHYQFNHIGKSKQYFDKSSMSCWGWSIHSNIWPEVSELLNLGKFPGLKKLLIFNNFFKSDRLWQIVLNLTNRKQTWAIFWAYYLFRKNGLIITSHKSFVTNIGLDGSGNNHKKIVSGKFKYLFINIIKTILAILILPFIWK